MIKTILQTNPKVEVTFREIVNTPTYIQKGINKIDFVCGNKYYYLYTELGRNDISEITFNFFRYSGTIWAKIVKKDLKTPEEEANWRGMYHMPGPKWNDSLSYDEYTKKIKINSENTKDCVNGCYLLMTIQINDVGEKIPDDAFHFFSIMVKMLSDKKTCTEMP